MRKLNYDEIKNYKKVYVKYEKDGTVWFKPELNTDGIEDVFIDEELEIYTIDKKGSRLTDLERYIEIGGVEVYEI